MAESDIYPRRRVRRWLANPLGWMSWAFWLLGSVLWIHYFWPGPRVARNVALGVLWMSIAFGIAGMFWPRSRSRAVPTIGAALGLISFLLCHFMYDAALSSCGAHLRCPDNIRRLTQAVLLYADSNDGCLPDRLEDAAAAGGIDTNVFTCPGSFEDPIPPGKGVRYVYLGTGKRLSDFGAEDPIILDAQGNHDGRNIGFGDGHVDWFMERDVPELLAEAAARRSTTRSAAQTRPVVR